jgi:hypothetical protein
MPYWRNASHIKMCENLKACAEMKREDRPGHDRYLLASETGLLITLVR